MQTEDSYVAFIADNDNLVFVIKHKGDNVVNSPRIIYDGGKHASLYRNENTVVILDFLAPEIQAILPKKPVAVFIEVNDEGETLLDYSANITIVKENPYTKNIPLP